MASKTLKVDLDKINSGIADRSNVFYWQTDRSVDPAEAGHIWADRHRYFTDDELLSRINNEITHGQVAEIDPLDLDAQTNLGNVNSVRVAHLTSGEAVIIRSHPKGIKNGYFHAESVASRCAKEAGLPSYDTFAVHDFEGGDDFAFQVIEKLPGTAIKKWLELHPEDEQKIIEQVGRMMARVHQVDVRGFGPFDNEKAKKSELAGLHQTQGEALRAGLPFNLDVLQKEGLITVDQATGITRLFGDDNPLIQNSKSVLVHNDFADWNLLTDGEAVTGILDWDECVAGDPVMDIACWSTFFDPDRLHGFLEGYWQVAQKPEDFDERFELMRLRYVLSKMTLRIRRYTWEPSDAVKEKIEVGKVHLRESLKYFEL
ncbi:MAG: aminoglycoside phosphotransferase family protein [Candidatus Saccharibacteria bacterium]|nr:aminoglycoside phosphotransferase family protein [Candidatus Saccharibacteria bacterium]